MVTSGNKEFFPGIGKIQFEGDKSTNPLIFRYYDENHKIGGKSMKDHFRIAVASGKQELYEAIINMYI